MLSGGAIALAALAIAGCTSDRNQEEEEDIVIDSQRGDLLPQSVSANGLSPNGLSPNGLSPSALSASVAAQIAAPDAVGDSSRRLLKFTVGCALKSTQSFAFQWTDTLGAVHSETYVGLLGLAPSWATGPLDKAGQHWVSACLAARANRYEATVTLSLRGNVASLKKLTDAESMAYPHVEGAFWGNLFSATPYLHACHDSANAANSRARLRDCAVGQGNDTSGAVVPCANIEIVGECDDLCGGFNGAGSFYSGCQDPTAPDSGSVHMITSALP